MATKKYVINNSGEADIRLIRDLTDEQYQFLSSIFDELNNSDDCEAYHPFISIYEATPQVMRDIRDDLEIRQRIQEMLKH